MSSYKTQKFTQSSTKNVSYFLCDKVTSFNSSLIKKIKGITSNSNFVKDDYMFVAIKGPVLDGHAFIPHAVKKGAAIILVDAEYSPSNFFKNKIVQLKKKYTTSEIYFDLLNEYNNYLANEINFIGLTGTNGKTTTTYLLRKILNEHHIKNFIIGTIGCIFQKKRIHLNNTTPGPDEFFTLFKDAFKKHYTHCILEISSHSLDQNRINPDIINASIFTNLTLDHLDYHKTYENYFQAKLKLFMSSKINKIAVINSDDDYGRKILKKSKYKDIVSFGIENNSADFNAVSIKYSYKWTYFKIIINKKRSIDIKTYLIGKHNVYNILSAFSLAYMYKIPIKTIIKGIEKTKTIPGRLEKIMIKKRLFLVDYAHTPDALKNVLELLNQIKINKIITVFGCGGDRDKSKRPLMAKIAVTMSDIVIITSDNPRTEKPDLIIRDIVKGIDKRKFKNFIIKSDRSNAIKKSYTISQEGDIILIAGKGHEDYQIIGKKRFHFCDVEEVKKLISV